MRKGKLLKSFSIIWGFTSRYCLKLISEKKISATLRYTKYTHLNQLIDQMRFVFCSKENFFIL